MSHNPENRGINHDMTNENCSFLTEIVNRMPCVCPPIESEGEKHTCCEHCKVEHHSDSDCAPKQEAEPQGGWRKIFNELDVDRKEYTPDQGMPSPIYHVNDAQMDYVVSELIAEAEKKGFDEGYAEGHAFGRSRDFCGARDGINEYRDRIWKEAQEKMRRETYYHLDCMHISDLKALLFPDKETT